MSTPSLQTQAQPRSNRRLPVYQWQTTGFENTSSVQTSNHVDDKDKEKSMVNGLEIPAPKSMPTNTTTTTFEISTDPTLIPAKTLNSFFASDDMSWAQPLPEEQISILIQESVCFGVYEIGAGQNSNNNNHDPTGDRDARPDGGEARYIDPDPTSSPSHRTLIGFARWITDHVTVVYLTDVYILPNYRGRGLAKWLLACVDLAFQDTD
ncbi:hypothetical protein B0A52_00352 [Exophiala mesophila]|uniref:N-acetyltransferase domain-containing protein n=1 Tax=Exophiala mesophila TaxID=212818 RepID=A0A438NJV1_EXOME|nr:hypothetical protein B0A52_00352 [Exophiala mesophila]